MEENDALGRISLDQAALLETVRGLATGGPGEPKQVVLSELLDVLMAGQAFASPPEAWRAQMALRRRIIALAKEMPALTFVEGDA